MSFGPRCTARTGARSRSASRADFVAPLRQRRADPGECLVPPALDRLRQDPEPRRDLVHRSLLPSSSSTAFTPPASPAPVTVFRSISLEQILVKVGQEPVLTALSLFAFLRGKTFLAFNAPLMLTDLATWDRSCHYRQAVTATGVWVRHLHAFGRTSRPPFPRREVRLDGDDRRLRADWRWYAGPPSATE